MAKQSAGILFYRFKNSSLQVLLVHPGGPFWSKKDIGVWSIPKGETKSNEDKFATAAREVREETGIELAPLTPASFMELSPVTIKSGKTIFTWATHKDVDANEITSNYFELEWPPRSGQQKQFPEVDKAVWFSIDEAKIKISEGQVPILEELVSLIKPTGQ